MALNSFLAAQCTAQFFSCNSPVDARKNEPTQRHTISALLWYWATTQSLYFSFFEMATGKFPHSKGITITSVFLTLSIVVSA